MSWMKAAGMDLSPTITLLLRIVESMKMRTLYNIRGINANTENTESNNRPATPIVKTAGKA